MNKVSVAHVLTSLTMAFAVGGCSTFDVRNCKAFSDNSGAPQLSADVINRSGQVIKALDISVTSTNLDGSDGLGTLFETADVRSGDWIHDTHIGVKRVPQPNYAPAGRVRRVSLCVAQAALLADGKLTILYNPL